MRLQPKEVPKYEWVYNGRRCRLLWKQRVYDLVLIEYMGGEESVVPYSAVWVYGNE